MNKTELIKEISNTTSLSQKDVASVVETFADVVKNTVTKGEDVKLSGFITFTKKDVAEKTGVSKIGGVEKEWTSPAKSVVTVKLSKAYKTI
jgi:DNA-binding protein HU-beta